MNRIPFVDLARQYRDLKPEMDRVIESVLEKGSFILGENVKEFEKEFADYCGAKEGVGVNSATDALTLALKAVDVKENDEVVVPVNSFIASANAVVFCGAKPVFVDVEPDTLNIDPKKLEGVLSSRTKAIMPVHLHGHPADMDPINKIAISHGLSVVEDCAQAVGATYNGRKVGTLGDIGCFSFYPWKTLGACGDGGMVVTDNDEFARKVKLLRNYGRVESEYKEKYVHRLIGYNSRLDEIQAAILRLKLIYLDRWIEKKRSIAETYAEALSGAKNVSLPVEKEYAKHTYWGFCIRVKERDRVEKLLAQKGIDASVLYRIPMHLQDAYAYLNFKEGSFPAAERSAKEMLSLPIYPELTEDEVQYIADEVKRAAM